MFFLLLYLLITVNSIESATDPSILLKFTSILLNCWRQLLKFPISICFVFSLVLLLKDYNSTNILFVVSNCFTLILYILVQVGNIKLLNLIVPHAKQPTNKFKIDALWYREFSNIMLVVLLVIKEVSDLHFYYHCLVSAVTLALLGGELVVGKKFYN